MRKMKKLVSIMLALVMAVAMSVTAFAATGSSTITITNVPSTSHTFSAYQIFDGTLDADGKLTNITWGDGVTSAEDALAAAKTVTGFADCTTAAGVAAVLEAANADTVEAFAAAMESVKNTVSATASTGVDDGNGAYTYTISGVDAGYYLVLDSTTATTGDAVSAYILSVTDSETIEVKNETVTVDKEIVDGTTESGTSASADDTITFQLTGTLPDADTLSTYDTYKYVFHDTLSDNLTYVMGSYEVKVVCGTDEYVLKSGSAYAAGAGTYATGTDSLMITFSNILKSLECEDGSYISILDLMTTGDVSIVVTYDATLNAGAEAGTAETNTVYIEYSNNPNTDGTGKTTEDKVYVYTFNLNVDKVDENEDPLAGAGFTLYKMNESGEYVQVGSEIVVTGNATDGYTAAFEDLGAGSYKLEETTTPTGYNTIDPITFTITATYGADGTIESLSCDNSDVTVTVTNSTLSTTVVNNTGVELPSTGGIGTTIFYIIGGVMVAGAVVLLITRKRMKSA
ncbi:MAG: SpaH/EbpB family LPXTG-anchored major pilin [Clostridiales bacterium]|nr:SpaH/EbpB family LPXTG-anchored major pilin [Clostridiales bacterium]